MVGGHWPKLQSVCLSVPHPQLKNGALYGHGYYRTVIGNLTLEAERGRNKAITCAMHEHSLGGGLMHTGYLRKHSLVQAPGRNAPLNWFLLSVLYILFAHLHRMLPHLSFFLHYFHTYLLHYLSFPLRTEPFRFNAGCRKRQQNPALVFLRLFCVAKHFFLLVNAYFCCVRFSYFVLYQAQRLAWGNVSEITCFVSSGT